MRQRRRESGFGSSTYHELQIALVIGGILSAIAVPRLMKITKGAEDRHACAVAIDAAAEATPAGAGSCPASGVAFVVDTAGGLTSVCCPDPSKHGPGAKKVCRTGDEPAAALFPAPGAVGRNAPFLGLIFVGVPAGLFVVAVIGDWRARRGST